MTRAKVVPLDKATPSQIVNGSTANAVCASCRKQLEMVIVNETSSAQGDLLIDAYLRSRGWRVKYVNNRLRDICPGCAGGVRREEH